MTTHLSADVLVVGAGGAGMYAAVAAARAGASVILADKSLIGRGGATIMAQMTVAAAVAEETPDHWTAHYADTLTAGRGLCNERLAAILCEEAPVRIREMDSWHVGWARGANGRMRQVTAPGHNTPRCVCLLTPRPYSSSFAHKWIRHTKLFRTSWPFFSPPKRLSASLNYSD